LEEGGGGGQLLVFGIAPSSYVCCIQGACVGVWGCSQHLFLCHASAEGLRGNVVSVSFPYIPLALCLHMHMQMQTQGKWYVGKRYGRFACECAEHIDLGSVNLGEVASML
jgi:hypothetical protein